MKHTQTWPRESGAEAAQAVFDLVPFWKAKAPIICESVTFQLQLFLGGSISQYSVSSGSYYFMLSRTFDHIILSSMSGIKQ